MKLTFSELRGIVTDGAELTKGAKLFDDGDLSNLARHEHKLFADAAGSAVYKVSATHAADGTWKARCTCMAARSRPFCKHGAALLVAWQRNPDAFAVSDAPPPGAIGDAKKKKVKTGKEDTAALMTRGIEQVATLVRELAVAGAASLASDRAAQVRALGDNLREHKLRRLSAKTIALADQLDGAQREQFDELAYTELLGDLLLTVRKLEKHVAGEVLEDRHVEELIGKTWTKKDRAASTPLDLVEVAFLSRETADNFTIRESRFVDAASGAHYSEKQILPGFLVKRTPPKPSYAGKLLRGAGGGLYPGFAPRRTDLETAGIAERLAPDALDRITAAALPTVKAAIAALVDHKKDVFAPDLLPVTIACDMLIADRGRLQLADRDGSAVFLPDDERAADRLATALAGAQLDAVIGDLGLDGALPTIYPLAVIVSRNGRRELRSIAVAEFASSRKVKVTGAAEQRKSNWALTARALGLSTAAIALGEIREEIAGLVFAGLTSITARRIEPMAVRLTELGLVKQAELLRTTAAASDPAARLDDIIKLHQVLAIALSRLAGAAQIERAELAASPMFASVFVRKDSAIEAPDDIARRLTRGEINRFEAGALAARYYGTLPPEGLIDRVFPTWADGAASPFVALAAQARPEAAIEAARALLVGGDTDNSRDAQIARIRHAGVPRMAAITALRTLEAVGSAGALDVLRWVAKSHRDYTLRNMARMAMGRLANIIAEDDPAVVELRGQLLNGATLDARARAAERLADAGDVGAIPLLRLSFAGDIAGAVRDAAGRALGRLGDADSCETLCRALDRRGEDHETAKTAAYALGYLGDVRGVQALIAAYQSAWLPEVVSDALAAVGGAAIPFVLEAIEQNPDLLKRTTARRVLDAWKPSMVLPALLERVATLAASVERPELVKRASTLLDVVKDQTQLARELAAAIAERLPGLGSATAREERALAKKLVATAS